MALARLLGDRIERVGQRPCGSGDVILPERSSSAAALEEAEKSFRRIKGYREMPQLIAALEAQVPACSARLNRKTAQRSMDAAVDFQRRTGHHPYG
jgi:hypothetical protein